VCAAYLPDWQKLDAILLPTLFHLRTYLMVYINLKDKKLFGNEAGEDEDLDVLNSY
jgi:hypothetical protein